MTEPHNAYPITSYLCCCNNERAFRHIAIGLPPATDAKRHAVAAAQGKANSISSVTYSIKDITNLHNGVLMIPACSFITRKNNPNANYLELKFCVSGNVYCREKKMECDYCRFSSSKNCVEKVDSVDVLSFTFTPSYLKQFTSGKRIPRFLMKCFRSGIIPFTKVLPLCGKKTRLAIEALLNHTYTDTLENIFLNAQTQILLLYSMDCMIGDPEEKIYLQVSANETDREKITKAREILLQHIGEPLTIKALSRKVAINECYLKRIQRIIWHHYFRFLSDTKMEHAKYLLYDKGLSVTDVSSMLGYSSISHFKSTGLKTHGH